MTPPAARRAAGLTLALLCLPACFLFRGSQPNKGLPAIDLSGQVVPAAGEIRFDDIEYLDRPEALTATADRLCTRIATAAQKRLGLRLAERACGTGQAGPACRLALARCAFLAADIEDDPARQDGLAALGIDAAGRSGAGPDSADASYWYGLLLGMTLQRAGLDAIARLKEVIAALKAAEGSPGIDEGGPLRVLGKLYLEAPAWPIGPGDIDTAIDYLQAAADSYPSNPQNLLFLAEALARNDRRTEALAALGRAETLCSPMLWGDYARIWGEQIRKLKRKLTGGV